MMFACSTEPRAAQRSTVSAAIETDINKLPPADANGVQYLKIPVKLAS